jgi:hypothetical protein
LLSSDLGIKQGFAPKLWITTEILKKLHTQDCSQHCALVSSKSASKHLHSELSQQTQRQLQKTIDMPADSCTATALITRAQRVVGVHHPCKKRSPGKKVSANAKSKWIVLAVVLDPAASPALLAHRYCLYPRISQRREKRRDQQSSSAPLVEIKKKTDGAPPDSAPDYHQMICHSDTPPAFSFWVAGKRILSGG